MKKVWRKFLRVFGLVRNPRVSECDCVCHSVLGPIGRGCLCCKDVPGLREAIAWCWRHQAGFAVVQDKGGAARAVLRLRARDGSSHKLRIPVRSAAETQLALVQLKSTASERFNLE